MLHHRRELRARRRMRYRRLLSGRQRVLARRGLRAGHVLSRSHGLSVWKHVLRNESAGSLRVQRLLYDRLRLRREWGVRQREMQAESSAL